MRNNQFVVGLMSLMMFTACGKSMHLTPKPDQSQESTADMVKGKVEPLSAADQKARASLPGKGLPFLDSDGEHSIGSPPFNIPTDKANGRDGFVKASNLTFRATTPNQVPPVAKAVKTVRDFSLTLTNVRIYVDGNSTPPLDPATVVANQILCVLDKKVCIGGQQDTTEKTNPAFWDATAKMLTPSSPLFPFSDFKSVYTTPDTKGVVYAYSPASLDTIQDTLLDQGAKTASAAPSPSIAPPAPMVISQLKIDLKAALGLSDSDLAQWILDNSTVFEETKNYRKFQFVMGNNIYAADGVLNYQYDLDPSVQLPANWGTPPGKPLNGKSDLIKKTDLIGGGGKQIKAITTHDGKKGFVEPQIEDSKLFTTDASGANLSDDGNTALAALAQFLNDHATQIARVVIQDQMDTGSTKGANLKVATARFQALKDKLTKLGVKAQIKGQGVIAKKSSCAPDLECADDRLVKLVVVTTVTDDSAQPILIDLPAALKVEFGNDPVVAGPNDADAPNAPATPNAPAAGPSNK